MKKKLYRKEREGIQKGWDGVTYNEMEALFLAFIQNTLLYRNFTEIPLLAFFHAQWFMPSFRVLKRNSNTTTGL